MKAFLLFENKDFNPQQELPWNAQEITQDLELNTLFNAMALNDHFLFDMAMKTVLTGLDNDINGILYRQDILKDCIENASIVKNIYSLVVETVGDRKNHWYGIFTKHPSSILYSSKKELQGLMLKLKQLRDIADNHAVKFKSKGFIRFFSMLKEELNEEYFAKVQYHLKKLEFQNGILISAELGNDNKGTHYTLRKMLDKRQNGLQHFVAFLEKFFLVLTDSTPNWIKRFSASLQPAIYTFYIHPRDESGARAFSELRDKGINQVANALGQSADHILSFFNILQSELAFYVGCLNLQEQLVQIGEPISFPGPVVSNERRLSAKGLYDACLALTLKHKIVGNDLSANHKNLVLITGANQGGKSTLLRSIGVSQLMMQSGMFVPAEDFCANISDMLFTHFKREEDNSMESGKLDEELCRMSLIADKITSNSIILFNESFAATNEREGSEIARQIICALSDKNIKIFFVTHLYDFAHDLYEKKMENVIFLRAERQSDAKRTFKITQGEPLQTSYGEDLYYKIFENA